MPVPASATFDVFDWNPRYASTVDGGDRSIVDGVDPLSSYLAAVPPELVVSADAVSLVVDASVLAANKVASAAVRVANAAVGPLMTFEFDIGLTAGIPKNFDSLHNRLFVGAMRSGGKSAGILFSYQGMALASHPLDPRPVVLGGSVTRMFGQDGAPVPSLTVRLVVDEDGRVTVYVAPTSEAYSLNNGSDWADDPNLSAVYNSRALDTPTAVPTGVVAYGSARTSSYLKQEYGTAGDPPGEEAIFSLYSLRLSTSKLIPSERPVASASVPTQVVVGTRVQLSGLGSYDKTGLALSYAWELTRPDGSTATLDGGAKAATVDSSGVDLIGTDAGSNRIRFTFLEQAAAGNEYSVQILAPGTANSPPSCSVVGKVLKIYLATNAAATVTTTADDIVALFHNKLSSLYNSEAAGLFSVELLSTSGAGVLPTGTFPLQGGVGSSLGVTSFVVDVVGAYAVTLVVDNGSKKSLPAAKVVVATVTPQLLRHRPNAEFVFDYLPDFWKLVRDKQQLPALWSAVAQAVSADTVVAWQNDYAKTLRDISRRYQRRWLAHSLGASVSGGVSAPVVSPPEVGTFPATVTPYLLSDSASAVTLNVQQAAKPLSTGKCMLRTSLFPAVTADIISVENTNPPDPLLGAWKLSFASGQVPVYENYGGSSGGRFVEDPSLPAATPKTTTLFSSVTSPLNQSAVGDIIRVAINGPGHPMVPMAVTEVNPYGLQNTVRLSTAPRVVDGLNYTWERARPISLSTVQVVRSPYISIADFPELAAVGVGVGDYVEIVVLNPYTAEEIVQTLPVLAADDEAVFPDWASLVQALNLAATVSAQDGDVTLWTESGVGLLSISVRGLYRHAATLPREDLVSAPWAGGNTINPDLQESIDYRVEGGALVLNHILAGFVACTAGSDIVTFSSVTSSLGWVGTSSSYDELTDAGASSLVITAGNSGVFGIAGKHSNGNFTLDRKMTWSGTYPAYIPRYGAYAPGPKKLWTEVAYFDNWKAIESNFGLLVGVSKHDLEACKSSADYLSVVKGAWLAFVAGPTLGNIKLAVQAFLGMMFAEVPAQVISVQEPTTTESGYVLLEDDDGFPYTYTYPYGATLATHPTTGQKIAPYPIVKDNEELTPAAAEALANARLPAYTRLFDAVSVDDYISNPDLLEKELAGEDILRKYHTFVVDVPLGLVADTSVFSCVRKLLVQAKPAHTDFILVGSLGIHDDINLEETLTLKPTIKLVDSPHTTSFSSLKSGTGTFGQPKATAAEEILTWPNTKTYEAFGRSPATATVVNGSPTVTLSEDISSLLDGAAKVKIASDDGSAVLGFIEREVASYTATSITFTANYVGTSANGVELWVSMSDTDVKEKYESGYVEGVLDNYSGDGSWNSRYRVLDMVNTADSDIDVTHSHIWVPVLKTTAGGDADLEFELGEYLDILDDTLVDSASVWADSPPRLVHIGSEPHPRIPFGVDAPQNLHPYTYMLLGFAHNTDLAVASYGSEARLDAIAEAVGRLAGPVRLKGRNSGAVATPTVYVDRSNPAHAKFFLLEHIFQADKMTEWNLKSDPALSVVRYFPAGGLTVSALQDTAGDVEPFNTATHATNPGAYLFAQQYSKQVQQIPYDPTLSDDAQFVPSFSPGMFMDWDLSALPGPPTKSTFYWQYGFTDPGDLLAAPTALSAMTPDANAVKVENTHMGMRLLGRKGYHLTHGFSRFTVPAPVIKKATSPGSGGWDVRIEGFYFVDDDPTRVAVPGAAASSFDGSRGGGWVFLRDSLSGVEVPVASWNFETGLNVGKTVLSADGAVQTSTGHVIEFMVPVLPGEGVYDIVVRNYRPWKMHAAGAQQYHMDEGVAAGAYYHNPSAGWSGVGWGTGSWGGV